MRKCSILAEHKGQTGDKGKRRQEGHTQPSDSASLHPTRSEFLEEFAMNMGTQHCVQDRETETCLSPA